MKLHEILKNAALVGIAGHVRPDGDCVGSTVSFTRYLKNNYPDLHIDLYLEEVPKHYRYVPEWECAKDTPVSREYDVFFALDCGDKSRIGVAGSLFDSAKLRVVIDHHISNTGYGHVNFIDACASSTSEMIYELIKEDRGVIDSETASGIYMGIVQDTGVFQYSCTRPRTMEIVSELMNLDIPFSRIIEESFFMRTFAQNRALGHALSNARLYENGRVITSVFKKETMDSFGLKPIDLEGIVSHLRNTEGVEVSIFLYELTPGEFKISLRSRSCIDVAVIAQAFGGGGHIRAAGASASGEPEEILKAILTRIKMQSFEGEAAE